MDVFYTLDETPPVFYTCGNLISEEGFVHCRRSFDCNVLILVLEGTLYITQAGQRFAVSTGQYIFLRAGEEHYGHRAADGRLSYMWVHFNSSGAWERKPLQGEETFPERYAYCLPECGTAGSLQRVNILFHQLMDYSRQQALYTGALLSCSLSLLLMELTQEYLDSLSSGPRETSPVVSAASDWIWSNCHRQISVHDIAEAFHYNAEYLSSLFKTETGYTLVQFLHKTRIEISKNLLLSSNVSIKEAAYSCGFPDEKYYMRTFKKLEGMTPSQYKNAFPKKYIN